MVQLETFAQRKPHQLSGGQSNASPLLARWLTSLVCCCWIVALSAGLQTAQANAERAESVQRKLGITFVFVTHDQEEALPCRTGSW